MKIYAYRRIPEVSALLQGWLRNLLTDDREREDVSAIRKSVQRTEFKGLPDSRLLTITDEIMWLDLVNDSPHSPWMSVYLVNEGLEDIYVSVNYVDSWGVLHKNDTLSFDHSHAVRKIESIGFKCDLGGTSTVRVIAQY